VVAVTNQPGELRPVGQVDVLPLVNQLDGYGKPMPHQVVHGLAYFRYQGGRNAVLCDPEVGDLGIALFCDRDISSVKATKRQANPGSRRRFDMADGVYFGLCLTKDAPNQYLRFTNDGLELKDKNGNKMVFSSSGIAFTSTILTNTGGIVAGRGSGDEVTLQHHKHPTAPDGPPSEPTPGT
jgi:hypothetical protein